MITEVAGRSWRLRAACAAPGIDPEVFFPIDTGPAGSEAVARAKAVCAACPVRAECLADVMAAEDPGERFGVTGGLSAIERAELFARNRGPAVDLTAPALAQAPAVPLAPPAVASPLVPSAVAPPLPSPAAPLVPVPVSPLVAVGVQLGLFDLDSTTGTEAA